MSTPSPVSFVRALQALLGKELKEAARDRRAIVSSLLFAVLAPLAIALAVSAVARRDEAAREPFPLPVAGAERASDLVRFLERRGLRPQAVEAATVERGIRDGSLEVALVVGPAYAEELASLQPAKVELWHDGARRSGRYRRVQLELAAYGRHLADLRLLARGVVPRVARPLAVDEVDLSTARQRAAAFLATLPIFLLLAPFVSGLAAAVDGTAGERERGTLETLLLHPVPIAAVAVAKWLGAALVALVGGLATLAVSVLVLGRFTSLDVPVDLDPRRALAMAVAIVPLALLAPALTMVAATSARSLKEAQSTVSLVVLAAAAPGFVLAFAGTELPKWMRVVPVLGQQLTLDATLRGEPAGAATTALLALTSVAVAVLAVGLVARRLGDERWIRG